MPWTSAHLTWLTNTGTSITTADGKTAEVWEFNHRQDAAILSEWAKHFRNHYCLDADIDFLKTPSQSRTDYLANTKFPDKTSKLGPGIRAGDFGEILVADYLQYVLGFWVPRVRWNSKVVRDESAKGSDVIGFHFHQSEDCPSNQDILFVFEAKTKFSSSKKNRLQDAINDSAKDHTRMAESLNFIKQKFFDKGHRTEALHIERFQDPVDTPYKHKYGAAALISTDCYDATEVSVSDCCKIPISSKSGSVSPHPHLADLALLIIKGPDLMALVHELYRRAADEA